jgi:biotin transport system substrate-specific component
METRTLVRIALFAALIAVLGLFPKFDIPLAGGVPITMQSLGVMLAGVLLGPRRGALAVLLFVCVVLLGAPLLAGGRGGLAVLTGPTAGFLVGWIPGAAVAGWLAGRLSNLSAVAAGALAAAVGGIVIDYLFGIAWLSYAAGLGVSRATLGTLVFLPGDLIKAVATGCVAEAARRLEPSRFTEVG